jgi:hypothetical protein
MRIEVRSVAKRLARSAQPNSRSTDRFCSGIFRRKELKLVTF